MTTEKKTAGRPLGKRHQDDVRAKIQASAIITRLYSAFEGTIELNSTQVNIGKLLLDKALPDLKSILFNHLKLFENKFSFPDFKKYIIHFFNLFTELNFIFTSCPSNSFIINKKPFIIN